MPEGRRRERCGCGAESGGLDRACALGKEGGGEEGHMQERENRLDPSSEGFLSGDLRGGSRYNIHQLPRCVFSGSCSLLIGWCYGAISRHSWSSGQPWCHFVCFYCFSGPGPETQLRPRCSL